MVQRQKVRKENLNNKIGNSEAKRLGLDLNHRRYLDQGKKAFP